VDRIVPASSGELREAVAAAVAAGTPLEILGGGSKRAFGRPVEADVQLSTEGLGGVTLYEPEELVMSARAGTPLAEIEALLAEHRQELAFEPADYGAILGGEAGRQTIGGIFACNISGPRRFKAGAARDHILGVRCVTGFGEEIRAGGRVMKNVTGYDLPKLLTGSFGTLAVIIELTFKVLPAAPTVGTLLLSGTDEQALAALLRRATGTPFEPSGAALLPALAAGRSAVEAVRGAGRPVAAIRVEGPEPSVRYRLDRLEAALRGAGVEAARLGDEDSRLLWREVRDVRLLTRGRALWRFSLAPTEGAELVPWYRELGAEWLLDWAGGLVWLAPPEAYAYRAGELRRALDGRDGHATLVRAPEDVRARVEVFQPQPPALRALTERVKRGFDPQKILNRGRMYADM
jgi:glycolate oxidase FAD binding subunit